MMMPGGVGGSCNGGANMTAPGGGIWVQRPPVTAVGPNSGSGPWPMRQQQPPQASQTMVGHGGPVTAHSPNLTWHSSQPMPMQHQQGPMPQNASGNNDPPGHPLWEVSGGGQPPAIKLEPSLAGASAAQGSGYSVASQRHRLPGGGAGNDGSAAGDGASGTGQRGGSRLGREEGGKRADASGGKGGVQTRQSCDHCSKKKTKCSGGVGPCLRWVGVAGG